MPQLSKKSFYSDFIKEAWVSNWLALAKDGVFLPAFFVLLNASNVDIGFANSIPIFMSMLAPVFYYYISLAKDQKGLTVNISLIQRILWLSLGLLPVLAFLAGNKLSMSMFLILFSIFSALGVVLALSWTSWMADIIPDKERGFYFGRRNTYTALVALFGGFLFAQFMDVWQKAHPYIAFSSLFVFSGFMAVLAISFLKRLPPTSFKRSRASGSIFSEITGKMQKVYKDKNFMHLVVFNAVWAFGLTYSGAFGNIFLIRELKLSYTTIVLFAAISTVCNILTSSFWGRLIDRYGNKPVIIVCSLMLSITPFLWAMLNMSNYNVILPIIWFIAGICWAGLTLGQFNIILKLAPKANRMAYLSFNTFVVTISTCFAPILGGYTLDFIGKSSFNVGIFAIGAFQVLFFVGAVMRIIPIVFLIKLKEPKEGTVREVAIVVSTKLPEGMYQGVMELGETFGIKEERSLKVRKNL